MLRQFIEGLVFDAPTSIAHRPNCLGGITLQSLIGHPAPVGFQVLNRRLVAPAAVLLPLLLDGPHPDRARNLAEIKIRDLPEFNVPLFLLKG